MKKQNLFLLNFIIIVSFLTGTVSCSKSKDHWYYREPKEVRTPANDPVNAAYLRENRRSKTIYYKGILSVPPVKFFGIMIARGYIYKFLKKLPLEEEVRERVKDKIGSDEFKAQMVPFLLALKDLYSAKEEDTKMAFDKYILEKFPNGDKIPGLKHTLFTHYDKKTDEKEEGDHSTKEKPGLTDELLADIIILFDAIMIKDREFVFSEYTEVNMEKAKEVTPICKRIVKRVLNDFEIEEKVKKEIVAIMNDDHLMEALSISLMKVLYSYSHKHYEMFAMKYLRQKQLRTWMLDRLDSNDAKMQEELWQYLEDGIKNRRYAVQVVVDGLQGHLLEGLVTGSKNNTFLKKIHEEHKNFTNFKPKDVEVEESREQSLNFLDWLMNKRLAYKSSKYLPFFRNLYSKMNKGIAVAGLSTTPTISMRNVPMATTGSPPNGPHGNGLTNFNFLDRESGRGYYFWGNDAADIDDINDKAGLITMYQRFPHLLGLNCNGQFFKGAAWSFDPMVNLLLGEGSRDFGDILCVSELKRRANVEKHTRELRARLYAMKEKIEKYMRFHQRNTRRGTTRKNDPRLQARAIIADLSIEENEGLPAYLFYYNPWSDHFAHFKGPFSDEIISPTGELNRLDYWLSQIEKVYKDAGIYEKTLWGMAGDHGLTPVYYLLKPEEEIFGKMNKDGIEVKVHKVSADEGEGPKLKHPLNPISLKGYDVVVGSTAGGNHNMEFFLGQDDESWKKQPTYHDLVELKLISGVKVNMINEIITRLGDSLDYMTVREKESTEEETWSRVLSKKTGKLSEGLVIRKGDRVFYESKDDILGVTRLSVYREFNKDGNYEELLTKCFKNARKEDESTWCFEHQWRELTSFTERPGSVSMISHLHGTPLSGTVNIFPAQGVGFNSKVPGRHAGEHFHEKDAFVGVWGAKVKPDSRLPSEVNGSVPLVIYEWLNGDVVPGTSQDRFNKGWGFKSFYNKLNLEKEVSILERISGDDR